MQHLGESTVETLLFGPALRALHVPEPPGSGAASCTGGGVVAVGPVAEM